MAIAHNHPRNYPAVSADAHVTRKLREGARIIEIELLDHVIVGDARAEPLSRGVYSLREAGIL